MNLCTALPLVSWTLNFCFCASVQVSHLNGHNSMCKSASGEQRWLLTAEKEVTLSYIINFSPAVKHINRWAGPIKTLPLAVLRGKICFLQWMTPPLF